MSAYARVALIFVKFRLVGLLCLLAIACLVSSKTRRVVGRCWDRGNLACLPLLRPAWDRYEAIVDGRAG